MSDMEVIFIILTIAACILVLFLSLFLWQMIRTLKELSKTFQAANEQMHSLGQQSEELLERANDISCDLQLKLDKFDPLFDAIENVGEGCRSGTSAFANSPKLHRKENKYEILLGVLDLLSIGVRMIDKNRRS